MTTKILAEKICALAYPDIPEHVRTVAKQAVLDTIGVTLAAVDSDSAAILREYVGEEGGRKEATILGSSRKTTAQNAALVNASIGHVLDCDDVSWSIIGHPAVVSIFPALALAERAHANGVQLLTAFVAGYETIAAIGRGCCPEFCARGWHSTATIGSFGAAAAAGRILGLDSVEMCTALGIAGSLAGGVKRNMGTMTKHLHAGRAAANGVSAALLAQKGFTASDEILEGKDGFCRVFTDKYDFDVMSGSFCDPYDLVTTGALFKLWPSCYSTHPCIEAMITLSEEHDLHADDIEAVTIYSSKLVNDVLFHHNPKTGFEGKFSNEFCAALGIVKRRARYEDFSEKTIQEPDIQRVMSRVELKLDPQLTDSGYIPSSDEGPTRTRVMVKLTDGRKLDKEVRLAKGSPQRRLSHEELVEKFDNSASAMLSPERLAKAKEMIFGLEALPDVAALADLFAL